MKNLLTLCLLLLLLAFSPPVLADGQGGIVQALGGEADGVAPGHVVAPGETLWGIAKRHGTTVAVLRSLNGLASDTLHVGDRLRLPAKTPGGPASQPSPEPAQPASPAPSAPGAISPRARAEMRDLLQVARRGSVGKWPDGNCYYHVANFLDAIPRYGKVGGYAFNSLVPSSHWAYARQFAEFANALGPDLEARLGLRRLHLDNPYDAPPGAIVVVRAGTPGTGHPTAGDIAVAGGSGVFYNGGEMSYGGRQAFRPGNDYVLGIYVPAS
jgi:LysM repeat protein